MTLLAFACLTTLVRASSAMRYAASATGSGINLRSACSCFSKLFIQLDLDGQICSKPIAKGLKGRDEPLAESWTGRADG